MAVIPAFKIYDYTGLNLQHTFSYVNYSNYPQSPNKGVIIEGIRAKGGLIVDGGDEMWDLIMRGTLLADSYDAIIAAMDVMEAAVPVNTKHILKIDKTDSTYYEYRVKRIDPIRYPENLRLNYQEYEVILKVNSW